MWVSQLEHLENEYIVARTDMVGHNVCDNVVDLPAVLEIPGGGNVSSVSKPILYFAEWCLVSMTLPLSHSHRGIFSFIL